MAVYGSVVVWLFAQMVRARGGRRRGKSRADESQAAPTFSIAAALMMHRMEVTRPKLLSFQSLNELSNMATPVADSTLGYGSAAENSITRCGSRPGWQRDMQSEECATRSRRTLPEDNHLPGARRVGLDGLESKLSYGNHVPGTGRTDKPATRPGGVRTPLIDKINWILG